MQYDNAVNKIERATEKKIIEIISEQLIEVRTISKKKVITFVSRLENGGAQESQTLHIDFISYFRAR